MIRDGKAARREGKSEDLPECMRIVFSVVERAHNKLEDKKGTSPGRFISVRGFFCPGLHYLRVILYRIRGQPFFIGENYAFLLAYD